MSQLDPAIWATSFFWRKRPWFWSWSAVVKQMPGSSQSLSWEFRQNLNQIEACFNCDNSSIIWYHYLIASYDSSIICFFHDFPIHFHVFFFFFWSFHFCPICPRLFASCTCVAPSFCWGWRRSRFQKGHDPNHTERPWHIWHNISVYEYIYICNKQLWYIIIYNTHIYVYMISLYLLFWPFETFSGVHLRHKVALLGFTSPLSQDRCVRSFVCYNWAIEQEEFDRRQRWRFMVLHDSKKQ